MTALWVFSFTAKGQVKKKELWFVAGDNQETMYLSPSSMSLHWYDADSGMLKLQYYVNDYMGLEEEEKPYKNISIIHNPDIKLLLTLLEDPKGGLEIRWLNTDNPFKLNSLNLMKDKEGWNDWIAPNLVHHKGRTYFIVYTPRKEEDFKKFIKITKPNDDFLTVDLGQGKVVPNDYRILGSIRMVGDPQTTLGYTTFVEVYASEVFKTVAQTNDYVKRRDYKGPNLYLSDPFMVFDSTQRIKIPVELGDTLKASHRARIHSWTDDFIVVCLQNQESRSSTPKAGQYFETSKFPTMLHLVRNLKTGEQRLFYIPEKDPQIRVFGNFLVGAKNEDVDRESRLPENSPGNAVRTRYAKTNREYTFNFKCRKRALHFPGVLYIIDLRTGNKWQWETGQSDSEILYIDKEGLVYYRVFDKVYSRYIDEEMGLGRSSLLFHSPYFGPMIHWMWEIEK